MLMRTMTKQVLLLALMNALVLLVQSATSYEDVVAACQSVHVRLRAFPSLRCDAYIICFAGAAILRFCPKGTQFNPDSAQCDTRITWACKHQLSLTDVQGDTAKVSHGGQNNLVNDAMFKVQSRIRSESIMAKKFQNVIDSGPFRYVNAFLYAKPYAKYMSHSANLLLEVARLTKKRKGHINRSMTVLKPTDTEAESDTTMIVPTDIDFCPFPVRYKCDSITKFRTVDGSCNNLHTPIWGRSNVPHRRLVKATYGDGIDTMRQSVLGDPLPSARHISRHLFPDMDRPSGAHTLFLMTWGQFLDHDVTRTAITMCSKDEGGFGRTTEVRCGADGCTSDMAGLESCWPIPVSPDDPDFGRTNTCIKFVRSEATPPLSCRPGPREQLNQITPWIDGSNVYGSTIEEAEAVRDLTDRSRGRLSTMSHPRGRHLKALLPRFDDELCRDTNATVRCFLAGDERVNENSALTSMHTLWVRQHNRIEERLAKINPHWSGERLFQETKRIVGAMMQHIVINEQMPVVLGRDLTRWFDIRPTTSGYYYGYTSRIDPRISQGFATAAYRFGHTLIQDQFMRIKQDSRDQGKEVFLSETFFRPSHVYDTRLGGIDSFIRGLSVHRAQRFDRFFSKQVSRSLFTERPPNGPGMDLLALNIQRGRDHGIPGYNDYREYCGLGRASTFDDLSRDIPNNHTRAILKGLYKHVDDIDLFPGGVSEQSVPGAVVGPTFGCIIADQIQHLRRGDRFWYENSNKVGFTPAQLAEVRKTRLSRVMCANSDGVRLIQPWAMLKPLTKITNRSERNAILHSFLRRFYVDDQNAPTSCSSLPDLDLRHWRENRKGY